ncbi:MAG: energy transducer TonB [Bacteroidota bacterium]|nr:energy transducer TonB [Bacteroidota bacterium]
MKHSFFFLFLVLSLSSLAQDKQNISVVTNAEPVFPAGDRALYILVMNDLKYPEESKKKFVEGEVTLSFDVNPDSTVTNIILISGVGHGVDEEVKKIIKPLKFSPGKQNGMTVKMNTMYSFPVKAH